MARRSNIDQQIEKVRNSRGGGGKSTRAKAAEPVSVAREEKLTARRNTLITRLVTAIILVLAAFFLLLSMVGIRAVFLDLLCSLVKGLFGYGYWVAPIALLMMAWMLFFLHDEPIRLRMISAGLLTVADRKSVV